MFKVCGWLEKIPPPLFRLGLSRHHKVFRKNVILLRMTQKAAIKAMIILKNYVRRCN